MTRLWEKGLPLAERVLRYTAGEDHLLDAPLRPLAASATDQPPPVKVEVSMTTFALGFAFISQAATTDPSSVVPSHSSRGSHLPVSPKWPRP